MPIAQAITNALRRLLAMLPIAYQYQSIMPRSPQVDDDVVAPTTDCRRPDRLGIRRGRRQLRDPVCINRNLIAAMVHAQTLLPRSRNRIGPSNAIRCTLGQSAIVNATEPGRQCQILLMEGEERVELEQ